jgi:uncharacterized protein with NRDE domain
MCITVFRWSPADDSSLLLAANRDEFFERPTQEMHWWSSGQVLAGRDLRANGAWMGITRQGRFALVTNIRNPSLRKSGAPSRGRIVQQFLEDTVSPENFLTTLSALAPEFEGFNLLCGSLSPRAKEPELWFMNSAEAQPKQLPAGVYALSNASLDTPWPKVLRIKQGMRHALSEPNIETREQRLLRLLANDTKAAKRDLPSTGIAPEIEFELSSIFIRRTGYGTRASSVIHVRQNSASVVELSYDDASNDAPGQQQRFEFAFDE